MQQVQRATTREDILRCRNVMLALRPHLADRDWEALIVEMFSEGYRLAFVAESEDGPALAAVGYRYLQFLYNGKHIYIDDLSTLPESRGKGYGRQLLEYVFEEARQAGYAVVTLDSGPQRHDAHRLYLNTGFKLASYHFSKDL
jgi:GNAT superfamily N-acetyltransferase